MFLLIDTGVLDALRVVLANVFHHGRKDFNVAVVNRALYFAVSDEHFYVFQGFWVEAVERIGDDVLISVLCLC